MPIAFENFKWRAPYSSADPDSSDPLGSTGSDGAILSGWGGGVVAVA